MVHKRETAFIRETRPCKSVARGARQPPTLLGLARAECKVENSSVSISSAASQQNTTSILVLERCRRRGHRCRVAVEPKCAHTSSRHGRMWTWLLDRGWLGSAVILINISRPSKFQAIQRFRTSEGLLRHNTHQRECPCGHE